MSVLKCNCLEDDMMFEELLRASIYLHSHLISPPTNALIQNLFTLKIFKYAKHVSILKSSSEN